LINWDDYIVWENGRVRNARVCDDDEGGGGGGGGVYDDEGVVCECFQKKTGPLPAAAVFTSPCLSDCPFPSAMRM